VTEVFPVNIEKSNYSSFLDFGKEIYAALKISNVSGTGKIFIYYGESVDEAMSKEHCVLLDLCEVSGNNLEFNFELKAFRYVNIVCEGSVEVGKFSAFFEYLPLECRGAFKCSEEKLNIIWDIARYTLHLNTRELFLDGIKRDGWVWSADAYQSFLMNYYSFFDKEVCKRTMIALRGKDPIVTHINTIVDYSFFWFLSLYDYYLFTGDLEFLKQNYSRMLSLMDFCIKRTNKNGMVEALPGDWIFIDWANMNKKGEVSAEQILFCRSLEIMAQISDLLKEEEDSAKFAGLAKNLRSKLLDYYWNEEFGGLITTRIEGKPLEEITKHANIFAMAFKYLNKEQKDSVIKNVLLNDNIQKIKTPYFRFYELAALCEAGKHSFVIDEILDYWGGMLKLGATTFWEEYDPTMSGAEHYAMYGEPFDKSLCHAWGASPIYLLGKYYLGVTPLTAGYETYEIKPNLGSLSWIEGTVPTPEGEINVYMDKSMIKVRSSAHKGFLRFYSSTRPQLNFGEASLVAENHYEIIIDMHQQEYIIEYESVI
jgi:alpha-L-rhamnosidase